jgi:hypothetical protein
MGSVLARALCADTSPVSQFCYNVGVDRWRVLWLPQTRRELGRLPRTEQVAMVNAVLKLEAVGPSLGYPHSSDVRGADRLRELRPRGGRSPWRALYRRVGSDRFVLAAIAPEAQVDHRRFERAVAQAVARLGELEEEG